MSAAEQLAPPPDHGLLRFITCGSVDDGKSTLIGRLLVDTRSVLADALSAIERTSKRRGLQTVDLSLLTDGLQAEREQGITIDVAYRYFSTEKRKFIIADCPGHEQYTRNMATGASTSNLAIILIDARYGVKTQTRRHSYIVSLLGIKHVIVAVNKMDIVDYGQDVFDRIRADYSEFAKQLDIPDIRFVPISALRVGDDLTFLLMGGEVVADYSRRLKRQLANDHPWTIGYAYEVPCYIPSARLIKEGGYEADYSLIYYGFYGPFSPAIEELLLKRMTALVARLRADAQRKAERTEEFWLRQQIQIHEHIRAQHVPRARPLRPGRESEKKRDANDARTRRGPPAPIGQAPGGPADRDRGADHPGARGAHRARAYRHRGPAAGVAPRIGDPSRRAHNAVPSLLIADGCSMPEARFQGVRRDA